MIIRVIKSKYKDEKLFAPGSFQSKSKKEGRKIETSSLSSWARMWKIMFTEKK